MDTACNPHTYGNMLFIVRIRANHTLLQPRRDLTMRKTITAEALYLPHGQALLPALILSPALRAEDMRELIRNALVFHRRHSFDEAPDEYAYECAFTDWGSTSPVTLLGVEELMKNETGQCIACQVGRYLKAIRGKDYLVFMVPIFMCGFITRVVRMKNASHIPPVSPN